MSFIELTGADGAPRVMRWPAETSETDLMRMSRRYLVAALLEARRRQSHPYIAALEEVARALTKTRLTSDGYCLFPVCRRAIWEQPDHSPDCPVTLAKKLLGR